MASALMKAVADAGLDIFGSTNEPAAAAFLAAHPASEFYQALSRCESAEEVRLQRVWRSVR